MGDIEIKGAEQFSALSRRLKEAGEKDLQKQLNSAITRATKPVRDEIRKNVPDYMPAGYAGTFQKSLRFTVSKRKSLKSAGITIRAKAKGKGHPRLVGQIDQGVLRHPLYGDREWWYPTRIKPGFFTVEARKAKPAIQTAILQAMNEVAEKVAQK